MAQSEVFVLLGHWASRQIALDNFKATQQRFPDILGNRQTNVKEETADQGRTLYRNRVGPFADVGQARDFCGRLQAVGGFCFVPGNAVVLAGIQPEQPTGPAIHSTGKLQVPQSLVLDLDRGAVVQAAADVWFEALTADQLFLVPQNGAALAPGDLSKRDFKGCTSQTYSANALSLLDLPPGSSVCVKTRGGRIGRLVIDGLSAALPRTLALDYTVWEDARK